MAEKNSTPYRLNHPVTRLQIFRVAAGMTQVDLARAAGCSAATIAALERRPPRKVAQKTAKAIAAVLGVDVFEIFPPDLIFCSNLPRIRAAAARKARAKAKDPRERRA